MSTTSRSINRMMDKRVDILSNDIFVIILLKGERIDMTNGIKVLATGTMFGDKDIRCKKNLYFPSVIKLDNGKIIVSYVAGEAFESTDQTTETVLSDDGGENWEHQGPIIDKEKIKMKISDSLKLTQVKGKIVAFGYAFDRSDPDHPLSNKKTGGVLNSEIYCLESKDEGKTWSSPAIIPNSFNDPVEASSPLLILSNGHWVTPIANFLNWEGKNNKGLHGRLLRSEDRGKTWNDDTVTMKFDAMDTTVWEQRICQLGSGPLVVIAWNIELNNNKDLANHFILSKDDGKTFSYPQSTGIMGQTSYIAHLGNDHVLALHCVRKDTDRPGIYAYIVDLSKGRWDIRGKAKVWDPSYRIRADKKAADVFAYLKFGQPSVAKLRDHEYLMTNWWIDKGHGKICWTKLEIK